MLYAITPAAVLILNLILNWELFKNYGFYAKKTDRQMQARVRYNWFLLSACCYFVVDMCWGLLYERRGVDAFFPYIYWLTVFYFMFMLFTMLAWTRYMLSSLGNGGWRSKVLLHFGGKSAEKSGFRKHCGCENRFNCCARFGHDQKTALLGNLAA